MPMIHGLILLNSKITMKTLNQNLEFVHVLGHVIQAII